MLRSSTPQLQPKVSIPYAIEPKPVIPPSSWEVMILTIRLLVGLLVTGLAGLTRIATATPEIARILFLNVMTTILVLLVFGVILGQLVL